MAVPMLSSGTERNWAALLPAVCAATMLLPRPFTAPVVRLYNVYGIEPQSTSINDGILVWVESSESSCCLFVDELLGKQQVVIKPLPSYLNNFKIKDAGIAGCTILGDGNISLILDVTNLMDFISGSAGY